MKENKKHFIQEANNYYAKKKYDSALLSYITASLKTPQLAELLIPTILRTIKKTALENEKIVIIDNNETTPNGNSLEFKKIDINTNILISQRKNTTSDADYTYEDLDQFDEIIKATEFLIKLSTKKIYTPQKTPATTWLTLIHAALTQNKSEILELENKDIELGKHLPKTIHQLLEHLNIETLPPCESTDHPIKLSQKSSSLFKALIRINAREEIAVLKYKKINYSQTNQEYVTNLFEEVLGRAAQLHEINHYTHTLNTGEHTRHILSEIIIHGEEYKNIPTREKSNTNNNTFFKIPRPWELRCDNISVEQFENPTVSIVIPVYEKPEYTIACIRSIANNKPSIPYEIIVIDDNSPDNSTEKIAEIKNLKIIKNETNLGFLKSCNTGIPHAKGEYIFLLNNDTAVLPHFLETLLEVFVSRADAGIVGSKLLYPNGMLQEAGGILWNDGSAWNFGRNQNPSLPEFNYLRAVDYCSGAAIMFRKKTFIDLGKFDESYAPAYYEDTDFAFKVRKIGLNVYLQPRSIVIHHEGVSHGTSVTKGLKSYQEKNAVKFKEKWSKELSFHYSNGESVFSAKDRIFKRSITIFIDHYIPQIDKDAGSRSSWHLMRALQKKFGKIKFWPDNNYYDIKYAKYLESIGIEIIAGDTYVGKFKEWLSTNHSKIKTIILNRPHVSQKYIDEIRIYPEIKIIYYGHDIHYKRMEMESATRGINIKPEIKKMKKIEEEIWNKVDLIYYPSEDEINFIVNSHPNVHTRAKTIPVYAYDDDELRNNTVQNLNPTVLFVGGFRHSPNINAAKRLINNIWPQVIKIIPDAQLTIVGSHPPKELTQVKLHKINITGYVSDERLEEIYMDTMICVAPLAFGGGMKGKIIEAMKYGIPVVTTSVGAQGLSKAKDTLVVSDSDESIAHNIVKLMSDKKTRNELRKKSENFIKNYFSESALLQTIENDFL